MALRGEHEFPLRPWFLRRLLPVVFFAGAVMATTGPVAYHLLKRHELAAQTRHQAELAARAVLLAVQDDPRLWPYDAPRLAERMIDEGLAQADALVVRDGNGGEVPVELSGVSSVEKLPLLWGRADVRYGGAVVASVWVGQSASALWAATFWLGLGFTLLAFVTGGALILLPSRTLETAEQRIAELAGKLGLTLQEHERRRIARELHDGVGQALTAARLQALALERRAGGSPELATVCTLLDEALDEIKLATATLMPPALAELGLTGALARHGEAFGSATGLRVEMELPVELARLPAEVEVACYRIVQEALHNTVQHAQARAARVRLLVAADRLTLEVTDDGRGFTEPVRGGHGLTYIRERVRLLGGTVSFGPSLTESSGGSGAAAGGRVAVQVPLTEVRT